jgi:hypothetical protein
MQSAATAILKLARDPRFLGAATPGLLAVLHTWTRAMLFHPHAHLLVTAGGMSDDGLAWIKPKYPRFLLPERALSEIFQGKFRHRLKKAGLFALVPKAAWDKPWVVDCQHAGSGEKVLDYLGRYLFRIAIANSRLDRLDDNGSVSFHYRDNRTRQLKTATVSAEEFISRFLAHVLPEGFTKVRYSGLFSSCNRNRLETAHALLAPPTKATPTADTTPQAGGVDGIAADTTQKAERDPTRCPHCNIGRLVVLEVIPRPRRDRGRPP